MSSVPDSVAPRWLCDFVREEVRPYLRDHSRAALEGLDRWHARHAEQQQRLDEWEAGRREYLFRVAALPPEQRPDSERPGPGYFWFEGPTDWVDGKLPYDRGFWVPPEWSQDNKPNVDWPMPPPPNLDLSPDECWAGLLAVHDEVWNSSQRIGPDVMDSPAYRRWPYFWRLRSRVLAPSVTHQGGLVEAHITALRAMLQTASASLAPHSAGGGGGERDRHPDGPEAGVRVWYGGEPVQVTGRIYAVIDYMWERESASFDDLADAVNQAVQDGTVHIWVNRANNVLRPLPLLWELEADGVNRFVRKRLR